jgi:hypothetical protein
MLQKLLPWANIVSQSYGLSESCCQPSGSDRCRYSHNVPRSLTGTCMAFPRHSAANQFTPTAGVINLLRTTLRTTDPRPLDFNALLDVIGLIRL